MCDQQNSNICKETGVKLEQSHWYYHVPKVVEKSREGKVTIF
jgi:hypothetical protein